MGDHGGLGVEAAIWLHPDHASTEIGQVVILSRWEILLGVCHIVATIWKLAACVWAVAVVICHVGVGCGQQQRICKLSLKRKRLLII